MPTGKQFRTCLTLGATGMLKGALQHLGGRSETTWVLSRRGIEFVKESSIEGLNGLDIDYADADEFWQIVSMAIDFEEIDLALLWVHDQGKPVLIELIKRLTDRSIKTIHVSGSATGNPAKQSARILKHIGSSNLVHYVPVVLGAVKTQTGQRWLTHAEISTGAIKAIETGKPQMVGTSLENL